MKDRITRAAQNVLRGFDRKAHRTTDPKHNSDRMSVAAAYLAQLYDAVHDRPKATRLPLSVEQVRRRKDKDGYVRIVFPFEMGELMTSEDCINDIISAHVSGGDDTMLEDISFRPVGVDGDMVLVEVTGDVTGWLDRADDASSRLDGDAEVDRIGLRAAKAGTLV